MNFNSLLELTDKSNNEFYPTPEPIVSKMLNDVDLYNFNTILEPSAGKGDILREIAKLLGLDWSCVKQRYFDYIHDNPELLEVTE